jgi:nucleoid DNA-binding protein
MSAMLCIKNGTNNRSKKGFSNLIGALAPIRGYYGVSPLQKIKETPLFFGIIKNMKNNDFFDEVSQLCNYCDKELVKSVYYAMIKVISRGLRGKGTVKMPDWGEFYLHNYAPRQISEVNTGKIRSLGIKKVVKFNPDYKVKAYFKNSL